MPQAKKNEILTVKEVSEYLRCHPITVYRFVARGELPCFRIGSEIRFERSSINRWIENHSAAGRLSRS